jgi:hypothetical protein
MLPQVQRSAQTGGDSSTVPPATSSQPRFVLWLARDLAAAHCRDLAKAAALTRCWDGSLSSIC